MAGSASSAAPPSAVQRHLEQRAEHGGEAPVGPDTDGKVLGDRAASGTVEALRKNIQPGALLVDGTGRLVAQQPVSSGLGAPLGGAG